MGIDIIRLICVLILSIFIFYKYLLDVWSEKYLERSALQYIKKFFSVRTILGVLIISVYTTTFIIKIIFLDTDITTFVPDQSNAFFLSTNQETYSSANMFNIDNILESGLLCIFFITIIQLILESRYLSNLNDYITSSIGKTIFLFLIFFKIIFVFSVMALNVYGLENSDYNTFSNAFLNTILKSAGIFAFIPPQTAPSIRFWTIFYEFFFYLVIVYLLINVFYGIYIDMYRLSALKFKGKDIKLFEDDEKEENKPEAKNFV